MPLVIAMRDYISRCKLEIGQLTGQARVDAALSLQKIIPPDADYSPYDLGRNIHGNMPAKGNAAEILLEHLDVLESVSKGTVPWDAAYDVIVARRGYEPAADLTQKTMKLALICTQYCNAAQVVEILTMAREQMRLAAEKPKPRRARQATKSPTAPSVVVVEHLTAAGPQEDDAANAQQEEDLEQRILDAVALAKQRTRENPGIQEVVVIDHHHKDPSKGQIFAGKYQVFIPEDANIRWDKLPFNKQKLEELCGRIAQEQSTRGDDFKNYREDVWQAKLTNNYRVILGAISSGQYVVLGIKPREEMNGFDFRTMDGAIKKYAGLARKIFHNNGGAAPAP